MKNIVILCLITSTLCLMLSCNREEPFACNKNTPINVNGENLCGSIRVERHVVSTDFDPIEYETLYMRLDYSGVFRELGVTLTGKTIQEGNTYVPLEAYYGGDGISGSIELTITKMDRDKRIISGKFKFTGEWFNASNTTTYDHNASGTFTDVNY